MIALDADVSISIQAEGDMSIRMDLDGEESNFQQVRIVDWYDGPTTVTPSEETQTLQTTNKTIPGEIVVEPIPSNYGRVTRVGAYLIIE